MAMGIFGGYKASKLKPQLKMAVTRFQISANKKSAIMKQQIREIATLLADDPPKEEKARIKAEALIRDDNTVEAYEILQLNCELLSERIHLISHSRDCPQDLVSCVSTVIWASVVVDIPELIEVRKQFKYKYGKEFDECAMQNIGGILNERVTAKLSVQPPSAYLVQTYLEKIADEHEVGWKPKVPLTGEEILEPMRAPDGFSVLVGGGSGLNTVAVDDNLTKGPQPDAPPVSPTTLLAGFNIPVAPTGGGASVSTMASTKQPSAYTPVLPTPSSASKPPPPTIDDIEEQNEIFIPGGSKSPAAANRYSNTKEDDDNDESNEGDVSGGESNAANGAEKQSAGEGSQAAAGASVNDAPTQLTSAGKGVDGSYDDLAARFMALQTPK